MGKLQQMPKYAMIVLTKHTASANAHGTDCRIGKMQ